MRRVFLITAHFAPTFLLPFFQKKTNRYVILPYYHTVSDRPLPHVSPLYRHRTVAEFRADLDWLMAHYTPIRWDEIDAYERAQKPAFCLTFDDGFKEFYTVAAPILEEKKIPCVCFLNSAFIDNQEMMFRNKEALSRQGIDWQKYLRTEEPYLTTEQIRELQDRGFEFGSHSIDHPHFAQIPLSEQLRQTIESSRMLQQKFHLRHRLFSFPFGQEDLDLTSLRVHMGTHEAIFGTKNLRPSMKNLYNRLWMEHTSVSAKNIVLGEYIREMLHILTDD